MDEVVVQGDTKRRLLGLQESALVGDGRLGTKGYARATQDEESFMIRRIRTCFSFSFPCGSGSSSLFLFIVFFHQCRLQSFDWEQIA